MSFKRLQRALFRTMAAVVALAILFCIGLYGYRTMFGYTYDSSLSDEDLAASVTADENITNIALFGLDTREGDKQSHSDCMMIVTVDNTRGKIKLISLMRDSLVDIDGYGEDKLNAAYFRGGPSGYPHHQREFRHGYQGLRCRRLRAAGADRRRNRRRGHRRAER